MPIATDTGASSASTPAARTAQGRSRVASISGCNPRPTSTHHARIAAPTARSRRTRPATMLPRPEDTSIPVSTRENAAVLSSRYRLARPIRNISMNRKPRPSEAKVTAGASTRPVPRMRAPNSSGTSSTSAASTTACSSTATLTSWPISACGSSSRRCSTVRRWARRRMSYAKGRSSVAGRRSNASDDSVGRPARIACASSATASCAPSPAEVMVPSSKETAGRSL